MGLQNSTANARLVYENAKNILADTGVNLHTAKLTQSYLRLDAQALVGTTQFKFPVLINQVNNAGTIFNTEQRLNLQDAFVASAWGFFLSKPSSNTDATAPLLTYPDRFVFSTANVATAAETLYNGNFSLAVNNDVILPAWPVMKHKMVPQTQQNAALASGINIDQLDLSSDGFAPIEPNLVFIGSKNSVLTLNIAAALAAVEAFQRLSVVFYGVLAQNSTIIT